MPREIKINVMCRWDAEAKTWWAESPDLPGLVTEAANLPDLIQRVMEIAPELVKDNLLNKQHEPFMLSLLPVYQQSVQA